jgi:DNA polymerase V
MSKPVQMRRMPQTAHVDVNCFYASAEQAFDPSPDGEPVIVLPNNDGCAVTRSPRQKPGHRDGRALVQARPAGKGMGPRRAPSSNYELHGDVSARVMELMGRYQAWLEVYSIDEAFLCVKGTPAELLAMGRSMKTAVRRNVGVPVCVGIAPTKTLAKLANKWAKNNKAFDGVCHWDSVPAAAQEALLGRLSVEEVWGIAGRLTRRLNVMGIFTITDLVRADPVAIRDEFSVVMMRTVLELQGTPCIPMEEERIGRDQRIFSRSFAKPITTAAGIRRVMSLYGQASARLAKHGLQAKVLTAFAGTWHFKPNDTSYPSVCVALPMPTADPVILTKASQALLPRFVEGVRYARAGIMVTDLRSTGNQAPLSLFENPHEERRIGTLLKDVTRRCGRGSIGLGHGEIRGGPDWTMKRDMLSPATPPTGTNSPASKQPDHPTPLRPRTEPS